MELPNAEENALHGDKRKAYEEERMRIDVGNGTQNLGDIFPAYPPKHKLNFRQCRLVMKHHRREQEVRITKERIVSLSVRFTI